MTLVNMITHIRKDKYRYTTPEEEPRGILLIKSITLNYRSIFPVQINFSTQRNCDHSHVIIQGVFGNLNVSNTWIMAPIHLSNYFV